jgi:DNA invertase Pin-like site-specific DNA recombinase
MNSCDHLNNTHGTALSDQTQLDAVPNKPLRVALYARVSSIPQMDSLETQIEILKAEAAQRGMEVVLEVREIISGKARKLPKRESLVESSKRMAIDAIMVTNLDRFGRSVLGLLNAWEALDEAGVNFISVWESIDTSTPAGKMMCWMYALIAEHEWGLFCDRSRQGRLTAKSKGVIIGRRKVIPEETEIAIAQGLEMGRKQEELGKQYNWSQSTISRINKKREQLLQISPKCANDSPHSGQAEEPGLQGLSEPPEATGETESAPVLSEIQGDQCADINGEPSVECAKMLPVKWHPIPVSGTSKMPMALHHGRPPSEPRFEELRVAGDSCVFYPV